VLLLLGRQLLLLLLLLLLLPGPTPHPPSHHHHRPARSLPGRVPPDGRPHQLERPHRRPRAHPANEDQPVIVQRAPGQVAWWRDVQARARRRPHLLGVAAALANQDAGLGAVDQQADRVRGGGKGGGVPVE
jgi:hypothetical protein